MKSRFKLQVKIWITSDNKTNVTTTVVTENLDCNNKNLAVYTEHQEGISEDLSEKNGLHFLGKHKLMRLEWSTVENNKNLCVFRQICDENCYYIYLFVRNIPDNEIWKICEVLFN